MFPGGGCQTGISEGDRKMTLPLMIDSGAYTAWTKKQSIGLNEYITFIYEHVLPYFPQAIYVNLDVIGDGKASYRNWWAMKRAGLNPLPIYHVATEEKWLRRYLEETDSIGLGAIAKMTSSERMVSLDRIWSDYLIDKSNMPRVKVHGMGITSFPLMKRYPWYSVDSTSWLQFAIYGKMLIPHRRDGKWKYDKNPLIIGFSSRSPTRGEKGEHYENLAPAERELILKYLKTEKISIGKSKIRKGKEEILEKGVSNDFRLRCYLNALFFSRFTDHLPYPRPFIINHGRLFI